MTAQSPSIAQPTSLAVAAVLDLVESRVGLVGVLDLEHDHRVGVLAADVDRRERRPVAQPGLDVIGVVEALAVGLVLDPVEDLLAEVVVGVDADVVLERRELVQRPQRLDLLATAGVEVDAGVAERAGRQRLGGLGSGGEEAVRRPCAHADRGEAEHAAADQEAPPRTARPPPGPRGSGAPPPLSRYSGGPLGGFLGGPLGGGPLGGGPLGAARRRGRGWERAGQGGLRGGSRALARGVVLWKQCAG